ncbi:MAG: S1/P1 nuclease [Ginsengibacter sp.]
MDFKSFKNVSSTSIFFFIIMGFPKFSFGWGRTGHDIVIEIAFHFLKGDVKKNVITYLHGRTPEEASNWMDSVRSDPKYDFMKSWHYIDLEKGKPFVPSTEENLMNRLIITYNELGHKQTLSDARIDTNLLILIHLIGDLHQPLHTGYPEDEGGNTVDVKFLGISTSLHRVWDDNIIDSEKITAVDCLQLYKNYTQKQIDSIKAINFIAWMNDGRKYLKSVYSFSDFTIDSKYIARNKPIIKRQLLFAGLRLAFVLEKLFDTSATTRDRALLFEAPFSFNCNS